ncbi:MAG: IclR family transcriptional regulator [Desulfohalobiaceae bacterium]|nr:IclR family transcriptional regulator [Desulfohalobiaceae bacterium]
MTDSNSKYYLQSLAKGIKVLQIIAQSPQPIGVSDLARQLETNNATITRCCHTLSSLGYVAKDKQKRWYLTPKVLSLGYAAVSSLGWRQTAQYYLEQLSEQTGKTASLSVMESGEIIYICRVHTKRILPYDIRIGSTLPVHCTSMGKVLLAFRPEQEIKAIIDSLEFINLTHKTISTAEAFLQELETIRGKGYAVNDEEFSVGLRSVAAPVLDSQKRSMAALNIAVSTTSMSLEQMETELAPLVMGTARKVESAMFFLEEGGKEPPRGGEQIV